MSTPITAQGEYLGYRWTGHAVDDSYAADLLDNVREVHIFTPTPVRVNDLPLAIYAPWYDAWFTTREVVTYAIHNETEQQAAEAAIRLLIAMEMQT